MDIIEIIFLVVIGLGVIWLITTIFSRDMKLRKKTELLIVRQNDLNGSVSRLLFDYELKSYFGLSDNVYYVNNNA